MDVRESDRIADQVFDRIVALANSLGGLRKPERFPERFRNLIANFIEGMLPPKPPEPRKRIDPAALGPNGRDCYTFGTPIVIPTEWTPPGVTSPMIGRYCPDRRMLKAWSADHLARKPKARLGDPSEAMPLIRAFATYRDHPTFVIGTGSRTGYASIPIGDFMEIVESRYLFEHSEPGRISFCRFGGKLLVEAGINVNGTPGASYVPLSDWYTVLRTLDPTEPWTFGAVEDGDDLIVVATDGAIQVASMAIPWKAEELTTSPACDQRICYLASEICAGRIFEPTVLADPDTESLLDQARLVALRWRDPNQPLAECSDRSEYHDPVAKDDGFSEGILNREEPDA